MYECTIEQAKKILKTMVTQYSEKDAKGKYYIPKFKQIPIYIEGGIGIGKTEISKQVAEECGIGFVATSMTHHTKQTLLGLPQINYMEVNNEKVAFTKYTFSEMLANVYEQIANGYERGILLLDEYNCTSDALMPSALAFLQTKKFGDTELPDGWFIVLCGNPVNAAFNKSAKEFDAAIQDRLRIIHVKQDIKTFLDYARESGMHDSIRAFLTIFPKCFYVFRNDKGMKELVTCRSWENLSIFLKSCERLDISVTKEMIYEYIKSDNIADEFLKFYQAMDVKIDYEKIAQDILMGSLDKEGCSKIENMSNQVKFGLSQKCYKELKESAEKSLQRHQELKAMKEQIINHKTVQDEAEEKKKYNQKVKEQKEQNEQIFISLQNFMEVLKMMNCTGLLEYYSSEYIHQGSFVYVLQNVEFEEAKEYLKNVSLEEILEEKKSA